MASLPPKFITKIYGNHGPQPQAPASKQNRKTGEARSWLTFESKWLNLGDFFDGWCGWWMGENRYQSLPPFNTCVTLW